jgi:hypothetical protein
MANSRPFIVETKTAGDRAVDGLLAGLVGGLVMAAYLLLLSLINGEGPAVMFGRFSPDGPGPPLTGMLLLLALAAICGAIFGLGYSALGRLWPNWLPLWPVGIAYGLLLLLVARLILLPTTGASFNEISTWQLALANALYGLVLGWLVGQTRPDTGKGI